MYIRNNFFQKKKTPPPGFEPTAFRLQLHSSKSRPENFPIMTKANSESEDNSKWLEDDLDLPPPPSVEQGQL